MALEQGPPLPASRSPKPRQTAPLTSRGESVSRPGGRVVSLKGAGHEVALDDKALGPGPSSWELTLEPSLPDPPAGSGAATKLGHRPDGSERAFHLPAVDRDPPPLKERAFASQTQLLAAVWNPMSLAACLMLPPSASLGTLLLLFWNLPWLPAASWLGSNSCPHPRTQCFSPSCIRSDSSGGTSGWRSPGPTPSLLSQPPPGF